MYICSSYSKDMVKLPYTYGCLNLLLGSQIHRECKRLHTTTIKYDQYYNSDINRLTTIICGILSITRKYFTLIVDTTDIDTILSLYDQYNKLYWKKVYNPVYVI